MLAQGGEFAFVLLSLARDLKVLPEELNKLLIIVVVITMALTPGLAALGKYLADKVTEIDQPGSGEESPPVPMLSPHLAGLCDGESKWDSELST